MRFHARLLGVEGLERPKEEFASSLAVVEHWARAILQKFPQGKVEIFEQVEQLRKTLEGAKVQKS